MEKLPDEIYVGERFGQRVWQQTDPFNELVNSTKYVRAPISSEKDGNADGVEPPAGFDRACREALRKSVKVITPPAAGWQIPDGYAIVPLKLTNGMIEATRNTDNWEGEDYSFVQDRYDQALKTIMSYLPAPKPDETSK